jgi:hypothetical protein
VFSEVTYWQDADVNSLSSERLVKALKFRTVYLNKGEFFNAMSTVPHERNVKPQNSGSILSVPMPNGTMARFRIVETRMIEEGLAIQHPEIKTYMGQGIDDPYAQIRVDYTVLGFRAMILSPFGSVYIDPYTLGGTDYYISYYKDDCPQTDRFSCETIADENSKPVTSFLVNRTGDQLRTYRTAIATTIEFTSVCGGAANALANCVTTLNRISGVYEADLCVRLTLIANNNLIIYTGSDPYTNNNGSTMLGENQANLDAVIGSANYDIGHVFSTGSFGGIAGLRVVCFNGQKARGATGSTNPVGDPWAIDYVAHEMGHQFGGNHTQNNLSCNANPSTAWEPGSGITIMGYAGVCAPNLANNSIPYIHGGNIFNEMIPYTQSGQGSVCPVLTGTGNNPPVVTVPAGGFNIPISTYFSLTGSATDPDNDPLTYSWEEMDIGPQGNPNSPSGNAPLFRPFSPVTNGTRLFPKLSDILNNSQTLGERLPTYSRDLSFRLTARDNKVGGGGIAYQDIAFQVTSTAGPFLVTSPNTLVIWSGEQTVTWDVANTNAAPVSCANVMITLSTDGGNTWPTVLAANTPNDGTEQVTLPSINSLTARVKIESVGNIFFDISNTNFTITPPIGIQNLSGTPVKFGLSQNYPNPFNPVTLIQYGIPKKSNVTLSIYDVTGRLVSNLINNLTQTEGYYSVEFDATNLPSGVYYYSIKAGDFTETRKMIMIK